MHILLLPYGQFLVIYFVPLSFPPYLCVLLHCVGNWTFKQTNTSHSLQVCWILLIGKIFTRNVRIVPPPIFLCICLPCSFTCKFLIREVLLVPPPPELFISCSLWCLCAELHVLWSYLKTPSTFCSQQTQISKACLDPSVLRVWWEEKRKQHK